LLAITEQEEKKIVADSADRSLERTLRKLAQGHMFFEFGDSPSGRWDSFSTRTLGLAVQRKMADDFSGDAGKLRCATTKSLATSLGLNLETWNAREQWAFSNFAYVLALTPGVARWTRAEKKSLLAIIRAKAGPSETRYLQLLQQHHRLRDAMLRASATPA
jgi:hypothetical protein